MPDYNYTNREITTTWLRSTKWNASLILTSGFQEFRTLRKVICWKIHIPVRTPKWLPRLIFCRGMSRPVNWYRDYVIKACDTCDMTCELWAGKVNFGLFFHVLSISALALDFIPHLFPPISNSIWPDKYWAICCDWNYKSKTTLIYSSRRDRLTAG